MVDGHHPTSPGMHAFLQDSSQFPAHCLRKRAAEPKLEFDPAPPEVSQVTRLFMLLPGARLARECLHTKHPRTRLVAAGTGLLIALATVQIVVAAPPGANFDVSPSAPSVGETITFASTTPDPDNDGDTITQVEWDFEDDGAFDATGTSVTHSYSAAGTKTVRMKVTDSAGEVAEISKDVTVSPPPNTQPSASFRFSPASPVVGEQVDFDGSGSSDAEGPVSYAWDLDGDSDFNDGTGDQASRSYSTPGDKTVRLQVTDSDGEKDTATKTVTVVNRAPVADFTVAPGAPNVGQEVIFSSTSSDPDNDELLYAWDVDGDGFDDGTGANLKRTFPSGGTKTVKLRVTDPGELSDVQTKTVSVNGAPTASFTFTPGSPNVDQQVTFDGSGSSDVEGSISYAWDLDNDGNFNDGTGEQALYSFASAGPKTVRLQVTDGGGVSDVQSRSVDVNGPPVADFDFTPSAPNAGQEVTFTSRSTDPNGDQLGYAWDLDNDGLYDDGTGSTAKRTFTSNGTQTVRLLVTDPGELSDVQTKTVEVNGAPVADFTITPSAPNVNQEVSFSSTSTDPDNDQLSYAWDLDNDGSFTDDGSEATAKRIFTSGGTKTVRLRVTDPHGLIDVQAKTVDVNREPVANFTFAPASPNVDQEVTFSSTSTDPDDDQLSYAWDTDNDGNFNDGPAATAKRSFTSNGIQTVGLLVTDPGGLSDVQTKTVPVNGAPVADFDYTPGAPNAGQEVTFTSRSTDPNGDQLSFAWDLDNDGKFNDGAGATAKRTFTSRGTKTVKLKVTDPGGLEAVRTQAVYVNGAPKAGFTFTPAVPLTDREVTFTSTSSDPDDDPLIYAWDVDGDGFDDGNGATATRTFANGGTKNVRLQVTDPGGLSDVQTETVRVNAPPSARVVVSPSAPSKKDLVILDGSSSSDAEGPVSYSWDWNGDGTFGDGTSAQVSRSYPTPGIQNASLQVTDSDGATNVKTVRINRKPEPGFIFLPEAPITKNEITFSETASDLDGDGTITAFAWDLDNDGAFDDGSGEYATYTFGSAGTKTVKLRVTDDLGASEVATRTVQVANTRPNAAFVFSPDSPLPGQQVTFNSSSNPTAGNQIENYEWDFDHRPGAFSPDAGGASVNHSFATAGVRTVALRVTETGGGYNIITGTLTVNAPPTASFHSPDSALDGDTVTFSSTASDPDGPIAGHQWDLDNDGQFDDGSGAVASRSFDEPGAYTVRMRVTDSKGAAASASKVVKVGARPLEVLPFAAPLRVGVTRKVTRIKWLYVEAPSGTTVTVQCGGRGCPDGNKKKKARQRWEFVRRLQGKRLRLRKLERGFRAGARIVVLGTKPGFIGKQVSYTVRRGLRPPLKRVFCLAPGARRGGACPPS
jgi:PKD repeat protein